MNQFNGFASSNVRTIRIPELFFQAILPQLENQLELETALLTFWLLEQQEGTARFLRLEDYLAAPEFFFTRSRVGKQFQAKMKKAVQKLVTIGMLLESQQQGYTEALYFLNSGRGKSLAQAFESAEWQPGEEDTGILASRERRTVFQLYEENIGPLTPLIADALKDAETTYQQNWINEAIQIAVENNVRRWKYIEAILASWKKEGRHAQTNRDYQESYRKYFQEED